MKKNKKSPFQWAQTALVVAQVLKAGYDIFSGIKGKKEAEDELEAAEKRMQARKNDLINHDFRIQNPYEDIDVTTKASELIKDQQAQTTADILERLSPAVASGGAAALATSIARQNQKAAAARQAKQEALELQLKQRAAGAQTAIDQSVNRAEYQRDADLFNLEAMGAAGAQAQLNSAQAQLNAGVSQAIDTGISLLGNYVDKKKTTTPPEKPEIPDTKIEPIPAGPIPTSETYPIKANPKLRKGSGFGYDEFGNVVPDISNFAEFYSNESNVFSNPWDIFKAVPNFPKGITSIEVDPITSEFRPDLD